MIKKGKTYSIVLIALFAALTAVFSQISIPIGPVPINLAMLAVFVAGGVLNIKCAIISQVVYVLLGMVGVPVFAGFRGGFAVLAGPTGGYILGYILAAGIIALICRQWNKSTVVLVISMVVGLVLCYSFGTGWFAIQSGAGIWATFTTCVVPFLPGDAAKIIVAVILCSRLKKSV